MEKEILTLILDKLEKIEIGQQGMTKELNEIKEEQQEMKKEIFERLDKLEKGQQSIRDYMINADKTFKICEQNHRFIEKLKKVVGE